jgi:hypothetical protein
MRSFLIAGLLVGCGLHAGCGGNSGAGSHELMAEGRQFLLTDEPAGAIGILEFREETPAEVDGDSAEPRDIVLLGKIGGGGQATWSPTSAEFMLIDPTFELEAGDHICTDGNCPFCKGKDEKDKAQAIVSLVGADGRVPDAPVRKLLPLEEGQIVVVRGQAEVNSLGVLVVRANGLAIRR